MAKVINPNTREWAEAAPQHGEPTADALRDSIMMHVTVTATHHIPMPRDPNGIGLTIGQQVDNQLRAFAAEGATVTTLELEIPPSEWMAYRAAQGVPRRASPTRLQRY